MKTEVFSAIVLAAGQGTRMRSALPKVLHPTNGVPMVSRIVSEVQMAGAADIRVVVGYGSELVAQAVKGLGAHCFKQSTPQGTADAVRAADIDTLEGDILICNGDHPLLTEKDIRILWELYQNSHCDIGLVTSQLKDPGSLGRVIRQGPWVEKVIEAHEASESELKIREINTGMYWVKAATLQEYLPRIKNKNEKKEFYLTDILTLARKDGLKVAPLLAPRRVGFGVNCQQELAIANRVLRKRKLRQLMDDGVVILDADTTYIEDEVQIGSGTVVYPQVHISGKTEIGEQCLIEPSCVIFSSTLSDSTHIRAFSHLEEAKVGQDSVIGPYARLRPQTEIGQNCRVGNFVEIKKSKMGNGSKANHHTYLGDAEIGEETNIGCGTITCNYAPDKKKYKTKIGDHVFVGSDTQFVAPVEVGDRAVIASGSTITKSVPAKALAVARGRQRNIDDYTERPSSPKASKSTKDAELT